MFACLLVPGLAAKRHRDLMRCARTFSPFVESGPDRAIADIRGLGSLMGRPRKIAERIKIDLTAAGFEDVNIAIAANTHAAVAAARGYPGITIIEPGDEARALARLPLSLLEPDSETFDTL